MTESTPFPDRTAAGYNRRGEGLLPGHMDIQIRHVEHGRISAQLTINDHHRAPNGYLHAGTVVTLADTAAGYGCSASLPDGAVNFTTIELKSNFLGTAIEGDIRCEAELIHGGRTTQLWDAEVFHADSDRRIAVFRCTQLLIYPRK